MSTEPQYYDLIASLPEDVQSEKQQWLHHSCGGNLQIWNNASIRCDKCSTEHPALSWLIVEPYHLCDPLPEAAKEMDFSTVASLAGQVAGQAGKSWLSSFLTHVESD